MSYWLIVGRVADIIGIISLGISIWTLINTSKIRKTMLTHVESSEYRAQIDAQIGELNAYRNLLIEEAHLNSDYFRQLLALLDDIKMAYGTILPGKLTRKIEILVGHIQNNLYEAKVPYSKANLTECISLLGYVITGLKKEKEIL